MKDWDLSINRGILTGYNDAFIIDGETKEKLISEDPKCADIIRPILRGRDINRYNYNFANFWLIYIPCGFTNKKIKDKELPENWFKCTYPSIYRYLTNIEEKLKKEQNNKKKKSKGLYLRDDQGDYWWELRSCKYMDDFNKQKIIYPCIMAANPTFIFDKNGKYYTIAPGNIIVGENLLYLLACLNSKIFYFALRKFYMGGGIEGELKTNRLLMLPVPIPDSETIFNIEKLVKDFLENQDNNLLSEIDINLSKLLNLTKDEYEYIEKSGI